MKEFLFNNVKFSAKWDASTKSVAVSLSLGEEKKELRVVEKGKSGVIAGCTGIYMLLSCQNLAPISAVKQCF